MPITGFLAGWNEQKDQAQEQQARSDLSRVRAIENLQQMMNIDKQIKVQGALGKIFTGDEGMSDPNRLAVAAKAITPLDPALGLKFAERGSEIKHRQVADFKEGLKEKKDQEAQLSSLLTSATRETYADTMEQYVNAGGKSPSWYTGEWSHDAPFLRQQQNAHMSALQQIERVDKGTDSQIRLSDLMEKRDFHRAEAERWKTQDERLQKKDAFMEKFRQQQLASADARSANARNGKAKLAESDPKEKEAVGMIIQDHPAYGEIDTKSLPHIIAKAADRAKKRLVDGEEGTFEQFAEEEVDQIIKGETEQGPSQWGGLVKGKKVLKRGDVGKGEKEDGGEMMPPIVPAIQTSKGSKSSPKEKVTSPLTNTKGWKLYTDAKGNKAYVGPNGEIEETH